MWEYKRVELRTLLPGLGSIPIFVYHYLRIACCGRLLVAGESELESCHVCYSNMGFVCPDCMDARRVRMHRDDYDVCPTCCIVTDLGKGKRLVQVDPWRKLEAANRWLNRRFPYGVPFEPTDQDLRIMDGY